MQIICRPNAVHIKHFRKTQSAIVQCNLYYSKCSVIRVPLDEPNLHKSTDNYKKEKKTRLENWNKLTDETNKPVTN